MAFAYPGDSFGRFEDTPAPAEHRGVDPLRRRALRRAREAGYPYRRPMTEVEVRLRNLDESYHWYTDGAGRIEIGEPRGS